MSNVHIIQTVYLRIETLDLSGITSYFTLGSSLWQLLISFEIIDSKVSFFATSLRSEFQSLKGFFSCWAGRTAERSMTWKILSRALRTREEDEAKRKIARVATLCTRSTHTFHTIIARVHVENGAKGCLIIYLNKRPIHAGINRLVIATNLLIHYQPTNRLPATNLYSWELNDLDSWQYACFYRIILCQRPFLSLNPRRLISIKNTWIKFMCNKLCNKTLSSSENF